MRQIATEKLAVILELKSNPIVLAVCHKLGLPTSTYYRWYNDDKRFAKEARHAIAKGRIRINDVAEAYVIKGVNKGDKAYVMWWLKVFHPAYRKQEKSMIEIRQKDITPRTKLEKPSKLLQPTTPIMTDDDAKKADPRLIKGLEKVMRNFMRQSKREDALEHELAQRGMPSIQIRELLKKVDEKEAKNKELHDLFNKK
jgi:molybdenum cofactor biosynthesis enzyme